MDEEEIKIVSKVAGEIFRHFCIAREELGLDFTPEESGAFCGLMAGLYNATGKIPSINAMKLLLKME